MAAIAVALITTLGVILVAFIQAFKKEARVALQENHDDHEIVQAQLGMIYKKGLKYIKKTYLNIHSTMIVKKS